MHWPSLIQGLITSGLTQPQIAAACGCGQSTISDLRSGATRDPRHSLGQALIALARERGVPLPDGEAAADGQAAQAEGVRDAA